MLEISNKLYAAPVPEQTFFFYDLETSGLDCRTHRIMQFAGQRTDRNFNVIGEPLTFLVRLDREVVPHPGAVLMTGITPQHTQSHGISEREAIKLIMEQAFTPNTIAVGFNNVRFDDEFIRFTAYRNFHDAYEWAWQDGRSRWDLIDVVRMVRALRPDGIHWPTDEAGMPVNTLEQLAFSNGLSVERAHDAMSDVQSTIDVARMLQKSQPKMFSFLLEHRHKERVAELVDPVHPQPFVYTSTMYGPGTLFTSIGLPIGYGRQRKVIVYNLQLDPKPYSEMSSDELQTLRFMKGEEREQHGLPPFPAKAFQCNRCPAVAPYSVLSEADAGRLGIDRKRIAENVEALSHGALKQKLIEVFNVEQTYAPADAEGGLYGTFFSQSDRQVMNQVRDAPVETLAKLRVEFADPRLTRLLVHYKARNCIDALIGHEHLLWDEYCSERRKRDIQEFDQAVAGFTDISLQQQGMVEELRQWFQ